MLIQLCRLTIRPQITWLSFPALGYRRFLPHSALDVSAQEWIQILTLPRLSLHPEIELSFSFNTFLLPRDPRLSWSFFFQTHDNFSLIFHQFNCFFLEAWFILFTSVISSAFIMKVHGAPCPKSCFSLFLVPSAPRWLVLYPYHLWWIYGRVSLISWPTSLFFLIPFFFSVTRVPAIPGLIFLLRNLKMITFKPNSKT